MIDFSKELVSALNTVLPTYYEMALTKDIKTPCISYMELNNQTVTEVIGANIGYSRLTYQVKVWGNYIEDLNRYSKEIDRVLKGLGFKRLSSGEIYDYQSSMIQKILTYEALALEEI